jgi:hypothetical protein
MYDKLLLNAVGEDDISAVILVYITLVYINFVCNATSHVPAGNVILLIFCNVPDVNVIGEFKNDKFLIKGVSEFY